MRASDQLERNLVDRAGNPVELHARVGEGGEGVVFHVGGRSELVGKIYHAFDSDSERDERQLKLETLVALDHAKLREAGAWPQQTLWSKEGEFRGFVMEYLRGYMPLHMAYQIKFRSQKLPGRDFAFLIRIARNLAACVHFVHEAGLVIGDLNESNVLVTPGAMVRLIDVDSFQVEAAGRVLTPKVGKTELMAPELHGVDMEGRARTQQEDLFSLAVLLFQTLVFGRHPFAGRPAEGHDDITLEEAIVNGWYVFTEARSVPVQPPPYLTLEWLPFKIRELFEHAFGLGRKRPSAQEWHAALLELEEDLGRCPDHDQHVYWKGASECPWCRLEKAWRVGLFSGSKQGDAFEVPDDLDDVLSRIDRTPAHNLLPQLPDPRTFLINADGRPKRTPLISRLNHVSVVALYLAFVAWTANNHFGPWLYAVSVFLVVAFGVVPGYNLLMKRRRERAAFDVRSRYLNILEQWERSASPALIDERIASLKQEASSLKDLEARREALRIEALRRQYAGHLQAYLARYSMAIADVPAEERALVENLMERGIRTAADVEGATLRKMLPANSALPALLEAWVGQLEQQFWSSSGLPLNAADEREIRETLEREYLAKRRMLDNADSDIRSYVDQLARNQSTLMREYEKIGPELAERLQELGLLR